MQQPILDEQVELNQPDPADQLAVLERIRVEDPSDLSLQQVQEIISALIGVMSVVKEQNWPTSISMIGYQITQLHFINRQIGEGTYRFDEAAQVYNGLPKRFIELLITDLTMFVDQNAAREIFERSQALQKRAVPDITVERLKVLAADVATLVQDAVEIVGLRAHGGNVAVIERLAASGCAESEVQAHIEMIERVVTRILLTSKLRAGDYG